MINCSNNTMGWMEKNLPLSELVEHLLNVDQLCRENDLYLIMKVCERMGYCKRLRGYNGHYQIVFNEQDVMGGRIPRSFMDTVRRTRQKLQECNPGLKPCLGVQVGRKAQETMYRSLLKYGTETQ